jgi:hypothetical protein
LTNQGESFVIASAVTLSIVPCDLTYDLDED